MRKKHYGPKYEKEQRKLRTLQRQVLQHLKGHGPKNYDVLYVHFDPRRTGDIGPALHDLKEWGHTKHNSDGTVEITESGLRLLEDKDYWLT